MEQRIDYMTAAPDAAMAVYGLETYVQKESGLSGRLIHLIKIRASILNGCAYCLDMHVKDARQEGLADQWIALIPTWREAAVFSAAERAVLAWTDALTLLATTGAPDDVFEALRPHYSDAEIARITVAIGVINVWNRMAVGMRTQHPVDEGAKAA